MGVTGVREQAVRSANVTLPDRPRFERKFVVSADPATDAQEVVAATGVAQWSPHPEYAYALAKTFSVAPYQGSRWHWEVSIGYEVPENKEDESPLSRPDVWSFQTGGGQIPALTQYKNGGKVPLTNTAGDYFEGLTTLEAEVRATITGNRAQFPLDQVVAYTNTVNSGFFLGAPKHTWLCSGISGQQATEVVNDEKVEFWQVTIELVYRESGHDLLLPNVGYNFVRNGQKAPCYVFAIDENGNPTNKRVRASSVQKLTESGDIDLTPNQPPIILTAQVYREADFSVFGSP